MSSRDRDLDRRAIERMRERQPTIWEGVPDEVLKRTLAFAGTRLGLAWTDLVQTVVDHFKAKR